MREVANEVFQLALTPRNGINAYLVGDTLIDNGIPQSAGKLLGLVKGRVTQLAHTHSHPDHIGSARKLKAELGATVAVGARDVADAERGRCVSRFGKRGEPFGRFPSVTVDRALNEGDDVAGFTVLDTPGHSPGHVSYWRESDRVLICGDVFFNMNLLTTIPGLHSPPGAFTPDPAENRASQRLLADLEPRVVLFGHGPPLLDGAAAKLRAFVAR